jgi:hypothetical protein
MPAQPAAKAQHDRITRLVVPESEVTVMAGKSPKDLCTCGHSVRDHSMLGRCTAKDTRRPDVTIHKPCPCSLFTPAKGK